MTASRIETLEEGVGLLCGDNRDELKTLESNSCDSCVTDPPYGLGREPDPMEMLRAWLDGGHYDVRSKSGFMGKEWDKFVPQPAVWKEVYRVLKPGAHVLAFFGTRTYDLGVLAMRIAGFEVRDCVQWLYGSGFPKSLDVSKAIDKEAGAERDRGAPKLLPNGREHHFNIGYGEGEGYDSQKAARYGTIPATAAAWDGWGTALKPACEPIVLARKPLSESTVAANVLKWGTGALNIDGCRVGVSENDAAQMEGRSGAGHTGLYEGGIGIDRIWEPNKTGRWPANVIHDGSEEVIDGFPYSKVGASCVKRASGSDGDGNQGGAYGAESRPAGTEMTCYGDEGSAARFFYTAKADADDRLGSRHPTVKPLDLMQYLVRLVTPPKGLVLDPFAGTGTTGEACIREGMRAILIEREPEYQNDIRRRMSLAMSGTGTRMRAAAQARYGDKPFEAGTLFAQAHRAGEA